MSGNLKKKAGVFGLGAMTAMSMFGVSAMPAMAQSTPDYAGPTAGQNMMAFGSDVCAFIEGGGHTQSEHAAYKTSRANKQWTDTASLKVGKTLYSKNDSQSLKAGTYTFSITPLKAQDSSKQTIPTAQIPTPSSSTAEVTFTEAEVANKSTVSEGVAFGDITYTKAGYYLYDVQEVKPTPEDAAVNYDDSHYYIVVYVVQDIDDDRNTLPYVHIESITSWHNENGSDANKPNLTDLANVTDYNNDAAINNPNGTNAETIESQGTTYGKVNITNFINGIETRDIILEKNVKGLWGNLEKDFDFTIELTGLNPGSDYIVEGVDTPQVTASSPIHANNSGAATYTVKLKDGGMITIKDLPVGAQYTITEAANDHDITFALSNENASNYATGHKAGSGANPVYAQQTNASVHAGDNDGAGSASPSANVQTSDKTYGVAEGSACATATETVDIGDADIKALYTNTRDFKTVTGLPEMTLPFGVAGLGAALAALLYAARRKKEDGISMR